MANIGGNITGIIQTKTSEGKNEIGEAVLDWVDKVQTIGWLGLQSGDSQRGNYNAKVEESTHCFLCDYNAEIDALAEQDTRMIIKGIMYDVTYIDNPDELNEQLEISLKKVGAYNG